MAWMPTALAALECVGEALAPEPEALGDPEAIDPVGAAVDEPPTGVIATDVDWQLELVPAAIETMELYWRAPVESLIAMVIGSGARSTSQVKVVALCCGNVLSAGAAGWPPGRMLGK